MKKYAQFFSPNVYIGIEDASKLNNFDSFTTIFYNFGIENLTFLLTFKFLFLC